MKKNNSPSCSSENKMINVTEGGENRTPNSHDNHYGTFGNTETGYEEFFDGAIPCPTCRGSGRIPRDRENELVALIPVRDKRLRPRRTKLYVLLAVIICLLIAGLLLFFFFPRGVDLESDMPLLKPQHTYINTTEGIVFLTLRNEYNISNRNFFSVSILDLTVTVTFDQRILTTARNDTVVSVRMRSMMTHYITMNVTFQGDEGYIAHYCDEKTLWGHTLLMPFQATMTSTSLGKKETSTLTTYQHVKCGKKKQ